MSRFSSFLKKYGLIIPTRRMFFMLALCPVLLLSGTVFAQNNFNVPSGNWNNPANWSAGHVPNVTENIVIPAGSICTMDASFTANSASNYTLTIAGELDVPGGITLNTYNGNTPRLEVILSGNGATLSGGGTITLGVLTVNTTNPTDIVKITNSSSATPVTLGSGNNSGTLNLTNGLLNLNGQTLAFAKTATINVTGGNFANSADGTGTDVDADGGTISLIGGSGGTTTVNGAATFYNVNTGPGETAGGYGNVKFQQSGGNSRVNGTFSIWGGSANQYQASGNPIIWGPNSTLFIYGNGQWNPGNFISALWTTTGAIGSTPGYPNNVTLVNVSSPTISQDMGINGVLTLGDATSAGKLTISGGTTGAFFCGGVVINNGSTLIAPAANMTVNGSWSRVSGTFTNSSGTVTFGGSGTCASPNTISGPAGGETFNNVAVINGVNISLNSVVNVNGTLTLTSGVITTTSANLLAITNPAPTAISGGSSNSYINGPLSWKLQAAANTYTFPVGIQACPSTNTYLPLTLNSANTASGNVATVQVFNTGSGGTVDGTLGALSPDVYWSLSTSASLNAGSTIASVTAPDPVAPYVFIAKSATQTGIYTSLGGTASGNTVTNSTDIGAGSGFFVTLGSLPIVATLTPTSITTTSVTLQGSFNTEGASLGTAFNWGTTAGYGSVTASAHSPANNTSATPDSAFISPLIPNTEYHYQATDGVNHGSDVLFYTAPLAPTVGAPSNATGNGFTASWTAPTGMGSAPYTYTVEVSTDPSFSSIAATQTGISSGTTSVALNTLSSSTTYYFRVRAENTSAPSDWSVASTAITTSAVPTPVCNAGQSIQTGTPPVIDGTADANWSNVVVNSTFNSVVNGVHCSGGCNEAGFGAQWRSQWDANNLYLLVEVQDPTWYPAPANPAPSEFFNYDAIEVYISGNHNTGGSYNANDVQYGFSVATSGGPSSNALVFLGTHGGSTSTTGIVYSAVAAPGGYVMEIQIPWSAIGIAAPAMNQQIGLGIGIDENHSTPNPPGSPGGDYRDAQYQWNTTNNDLYGNPSHIPSVPLTAPPSLPTAGTDQSICSNGNATLNAGAPAVGTGTWSVLNGPSTATTQFSNITNPAATFTPANAPANANGTYTLLWTVTNSPCTATTYPPDTVVITTTPLPTATISVNGNTTICANTSTDITFTGTPDAVVTYTINGGSNQTVTLDGSGNGSVSTGTLSADATYALVSIAAAAPSTCSQSISGTADVTVEQLPVVTITSSADTTDGATPITLTGTSTTSSDPGATYAWAVTPSGTVSAPASLVTTATPAVTSTYTLTATSSNNCVGSTDKEIVVLTSGCYVPNAFTPNGDGINDKWVVNGGCYTKVDVSVYNRWGNLVYHADNYQNDWDGTYKGKELPDATYYYVVTIYSTNTYKVTGNVTIMR